MMLDARGLYSFGTLQAVRFLLLCVRIVSCSPAAASARFAIASVACSARSSPTATWPMLQRCYDVELFVIMTRTETMLFWRCALCIAPRGRDWNAAWRD